MKRTIPENVSFVDCASACPNEPFLDGFCSTGAVVLLATKWAENDAGADRDVKYKLLGAVCMRHNQRLARRIRRTALDDPPIDTQKTGD